MEGNVLEVQGLVTFHFFKISGMNLSKNPTSSASQAHFKPVPTHINDPLQND